MPYISFHRTSTRPIPTKLVLTPLGITTTVCQSHSDTSYSPLKVACTVAMTFSQFPGSRHYSRVTALSQILRCSALMPDGPSSRCSCRCSTTSAISSSLGMVSSTGNGANSMGIGLPGGRTWAYGSANSSVRVSRDICAGGGGLSAASLYHPHIQTHESLTRGGVKCKEGINSAAYLLCPSLPICAEAHADPLAKFTDGPLGPLMVRSYPSVNGRTSLAINTSPPHPLTKGGLEDLVIEL